MPERSRLGRPGQPSVPARRGRGTLRSWPLARGAARRSCRWPGSAPRAGSPVATAGGVRATKPGTAPMPSAAPMSPAPDPFARTVMGDPTAPQAGQPAQPGPPPPTPSPMASSVMKSPGDAKATTNPPIVPWNMPAPIAPPPAQATPAPRYGFAPGTVVLVQWADATDIPGRSCRPRGRSSSSPSPTGSSTGSMHATCRRAPESMTLTRPRAAGHGGPHPLQQVLGGAGHRDRPGRVRLEVPFRRSSSGTRCGRPLHGGVISMLADTAGGAAMWGALEDGRARVSTIDIRIDYLRPGRQETPRRRGQRRSHRAARRRRRRALLSPERSDRYGRDRKGRLQRRHPQGGGRLGFSSARPRAAAASTRGALVLREEVDEIDLRHDARRPLRARSTMATFASASDALEELDLRVERHRRVVALDEIADRRVERLQPGDEVPQEVDLRHDPAQLALLDDGELADRRAASSSSMTSRTFDVGRRRHDRALPLRREDVAHRAEARLVLEEAVLAHPVVVEDLRDVLVPAVAEEDAGSSPASSGYDLART